MRSKYAPLRKVRCPMCGEQTYNKLPLIKKTRELFVAEELKRADVKRGSFGVRRVCFKCWYEQTVQACSVEEVAAALILLHKRGEFKCEGWGRGYSDDINAIITEMNERTR